jgi:predicted regulator of Ras-like GTPase activity (Roadblock/LC7/MglB family)
MTADLPTPGDPGGLDWLLDDLVRRLPGAERVIVLSADGLLVGRSRSLGRDDAEHLSAVASGLQSLARGASRQFIGGTVRQTLVEMDNCYLVVTAAGTGTCLAVLADSTTDLGLVAYEMNLMVKRMGTYLSAQPRQSGLIAEADAGAGWRA